MRNYVTRTVLHPDIHVCTLIYTPNESMATRWATTECNYRNSYGLQFTAYTFSVLDPCAIRVLITVSSVPGRCGSAMTACSNAIYMEMRTTK
jgi:hypothetical protein